MDSYTFRRSALTKPETWTLFNEGIRYAEEGFPPADYGFDRLLSIRLSYFPTRLKANNYVCTLTFAIAPSVYGKPPATFETKLMSVSYAGFASFDDNANAYNAFIKALTAAAVLANPAIQLLSGKKPITFFGEHIAVLAMLAVLFYLFSILSPAGYKVFIIVKLVIIFYALFYIWKAFKANKPGSFSPGKIPEQVLPAAVVK